MTSGVVDARTRRHSTRTVAIARDLHASGMNPDRIVRALRDDYGVEVSRSTVSYWVRPWTYEQQLRSQREARQRNRTPILDRMRALRAAGVTYASIGRVVGVDFGVRLDEAQVRYYMRVGREPRLPKKRAGVAA